MNNKKLTEMMSTLPDDAEIYREADHGQTPEISPDLFCATILGEKPHYADDVDWIHYNQLSKDDYKLVNAILIG